MDTTIAPPARLTGSRTNGPGGRPFPWGPIDRVHEIGDIQIVEYRRDLSNFISTSPSNPDPYAAHGHTEFHPFVNGNDTHTWFRSLDSAVVGAIAYKREGPNGQAAGYFNRMTLSDPEDY